MERSERNLTVELWRGGAQGRFVSYRVPARENQTVLDLVTWVQRHLEPGLAYRFACRVGMCGSCAMTVNGRPRWTCRTPRRTGREGRQAPASSRCANLPVIKDLVTDYDRLLRQMAAGWRPFRRRPATRIEEFAAAGRSGAPERARRQDAGHRVHQLRGLLCACDVVALESRLPRARPQLNRAWTLLERRARRGSKGRPAGAVVGRPPAAIACHSQGRTATRIAPRVSTRPSRFPG